VKAEFILPCGEIDAFQDGSVSAAVGIGVDGLERGGFALPEQFDLQARGRLAGSCVQYMRRQAAHLACVPRIPSIQALVALIGKKPIMQRAFAKAE
jgi:hypothetical protein